MISSPGWAGRQWRTIAPSLAAASRSASTPERGEVGAAALGLGLVAHADPDVGVDRVGAGDGGARVVGQLRPVPLLELVAGGRGDDELDPGQLAGDRQRAGDVVAVADVGEAQPVEVAAALAQGQQVGERLAGWCSGVSALTTGTSASAASSATASWEPERITIASR